MLLIGKILAAIAGAFIGGALGVAIPYGIAVVYIATGGDPIAAGVFSFFTIPLVPFGVVAGAFSGAAIVELLGRKRVQKLKK